MIPAKRSVESVASPLALYLATCVDKWKTERDTKMRPMQVLTALEELRAKITDEMIKVRGLRRDPSWSAPK
jgi:hypothetical protein